VTPATSGQPWWATGLLLLGLTLMVADIVRAIYYTRLNQRRLRSDELKDGVSTIVLARLESGVETTNKDLLIILVASCARLGIPVRSIPLMRTTVVGIVDRAIQESTSRRRYNPSVRKRLRELKQFAESLPRPGVRMYVERLFMLIRPVWLPATETTEYLAFGAWGIAIWIGALSYPAWAIAAIVWLLFFDFNIAWMMYRHAGGRRESETILMESETLLADVDGRVLSIAARRLRFDWN